ncbi:MAG: hypothetical protein ACO3ST_00550 [Burkholderiaceae bacterium]
MGHIEGVEITEPMTPSTTAAQIVCRDGITYDVIKAEAYTHNGRSRVSYVCKRPRGRRTYMVIGYENGTFSTAA